MLPAVLRVLSPRQQGTTIPLPVGRFLIGREEDCHLRPNSELVSRHHCVFTHDEYTVRVRDLGSTNGTFVNGKRLRGTAVLNSGDRVTVGKLEFEVLIGDEAGRATGASGDDAGSAESAAAQETKMIAATETSTEVPAFSAPGGPAMPVVTGDTAMLPAMAPGYPPMPGYPPQYGQPPYPYPSYPPPMYPGYYMPNMGYPMPVGYPQQPAPEAPPAEPAVPAMRLPDPATTGVKPLEPASPGAKPSGEAAPPNVPDTAASIIKQYLQRRPKT